jgi:GTP-binding protein
LVEGAAEGFGLGIQFLKHLSRTSILLHLVDIVPADDSDPVVSVKTIVKEIKKFSPELAKKERWLILNKIDLLSEAELKARVKDIVGRLKWKGKVMQISAIKKIGTQELCYKLMDRVSSAKD